MIFSTVFKVLMSAESRSARRGSSTNRTGTGVESAGKMTPQIAFTHTHTHRQRSRALLGENRGASNEHK